MQNHLCNVVNRDVREVGEIFPNKIMNTAIEHQSVVDSYIEKELLLGCMVHIADLSTLPWVHTSPFGVIRKKNISLESGD